MLLSVSDACIIHPPSTELGAVAQGIMRALPAWFGIEEGIVAYTAAADRMPTLIATVDDVPVGFMTIERHFSGAAETARVRCAGITPPTRGWPVALASNPGMAPR